MIETYHQLVKMVEPVLQHYKDDLYKHDQRILEQYDGKFVYGFRRSGTDLLRMLPSLDDYKWKNRVCTPEEAHEILKKDFIWIDYQERNTDFAYFDGTTLKKLPVEMVRKIYFDHIDKLLANAKRNVLRAA